MMDLVRFAEHVHGHLGWLAAIALVHPAIVLRNPKRRAHLAVGLAAGIATLVGALGAILYQPYRDRVKQGLFQHAPQVGLLFERKEHLAFAAIVLAWAGAAAYAGARLRGREGEAVVPALRRFAHWAFVAAAALAIATAALGIVVATYRTF